MGVHSNGSWASRLAYSFGFRTKEKHVTEDVPGPGSYNPDHKPSGPATTMGRRIEVRDLSEGPGPGWYDAGATHSSGKGFTMGGRSTVPKGNDVVGPGAYSPEIPSLGKSYSMGMLSSPKAKVCSHFPLCVYSQPASKTLPTSGISSENAVGVINAWIPAEQRGHQHMLFRKIMKHECGQKRFGRR